MNDRRQKIKTRHYPTNGQIRLDDTIMDYVSFGQGDQPLILLPGLSDGLRTVKGMALPLAWSYRAFGQEYRVFMFSRKNELPLNYSTRDMAADQAKAMEILGITKAYVMGVSQGGLIAQYLAIDYPQKVEKLVLAMTFGKPNEVLQKVMENWISMAKQGDYHSLMLDTAQKTYANEKRYRFLYPLLGRIGKPKDFIRFIIQAKSCLQHDAYKELNRIACPTLILGGGCDHIVGSSAALELAAEIPNQELFIYSDLGHGAYEEAKDFNQRVLHFLSKSA